VRVEKHAVVIRLILKADLPVCGRIYADAFNVGPYFGTWTPETAAEMLSGLLDRNPESCWCIAETDAIVGFAFCTTYGVFRGTVQEFAIDPEFQRRGLGSRLMDHILAEFRLRGLQNVDLVTNVDAPAYNFYRKFNFRRPERYVVMAKPLW
jgi:aminoglycoside 6'-N-acetyltransferase I